MRRFGLAMLGAGLLALTLGSAVRADDDTIRLGTSSSGALTGPSGGTDTELVVYRRGGGGGGHYRGGYGGYRGGYGGYRGGYGGYRGGYYGGYRGSWGGGYGGYYGGYYAQPYYGGYYSGYSQPYYYGGYYSQPYYGGYYGGGYYRSNYGGYHHRHYYGGYRRISLNGDPCSSGVELTVISTPTAFTQLPVQQAQPAAPIQYESAAKPQGLPMPAVAPSQNQTFPYDGGPQAPLPLPGPNGVEPSVAPQPSVPLTGKVVSLPRELSGGTSQYTITHLVGFGTATPNTAQAPAATSYAYPAYGEQALPQVRKQK